VPLGLILLTLIELKGAPDIVLHSLGSVLVVARLMHAYGSNDMRGAGLLRFLGAQLTFLMLAVASMACVFYFAMGRI